MKNNFVFLSIFALGLSLMLVGNINSSFAELDQILPEVTKPEVAEPEATESETTEPEVAEREATESETTEPEAAEPEDTETQTNTLLRIASHSSEQIRIQLAKMDTVPDELRINAEKAAREIELLEIAIDQGNVPASREHFLSAMGLFKKITQFITSNSVTEYAQTASNPQQDLMSEVNRMERFVATLKQISTRQNAEITFEVVDKLLSDAKILIQEGNLENAKNIISQLKRSIVDVNTSLREQANQRKLDQAKTFAEKYLDHLDTLISQAKEKGYPLTIINKLEEAKEKLSNASEPRQIIKEVREILSIQQQFDLTEYNRIQSRVDQMAQKIERISTIEGINSSALEEVNNLFNNVKVLINENKLSEALDLLRNLNGNLNSLENPSQ